MCVSSFGSGPAAAAGALKTKIEVHVTDQDALQKVADVIKQADFCAPTFSSQIWPSTNGEPRILTCTIAFFEKKNKGKVPLNFQPCSGQVLITDISVYKHFLAS